MKLAIIGDCHLGASLKAGVKDPLTGLHSRLADYHATLIYAINHAATEKCDWLVFTGDIFEHRFPHMIQQKLFSQALAYALASGIKKIWIVVGNHDQQRTSDTTTLAYLSELKLDNITIVQEPSVVASGEDRIYFYPYRDRRYLECATYPDAIAKVDEQIKNLRAGESAASGTHIMIGHMAIEGTFFPEEESELYVDNELMLQKQTFKDFNLTIMGHVHTPAKISDDPLIFYVGSLEKRGAFESHQKQFMILDLDGKSADWIKLPCRDFCEFRFDVTSQSYGVELMTELKEKMDLHLKEIKDKIVKCEINILADDLANLDIESAQKKILSFGPAFVFPIVPVLKSNRAARTELKETMSETETWTNYIKSLQLDSAFANELISAGAQIITEEEV